ncbi:MFS transporter [Kitasatospora mediocidica]|uniref:MFS transporter n=1 Tax=Kitasatospora mediocidica TaxID=58352 RepID=UPI0012F9DC92|nr:MFS transporter [Kitasatospora mediocidica]
MPQTTPNPRESGDLPSGTGDITAGQIALAWVTQFLVGTDLFVVSPLLPELARGFHVSFSQIGLTVTGFSLAYVVAAPLLGRVADRTDRRLVLVAALVLFSAANIGTALAPDFATLIVMRVIAGVAGAATGPTVYALTSLRARPEHRGQVLAIVGSGLLTALWVGAPLGALLGTHVGWRQVFVILACCTAVLTVPHLRSWGPVDTTARPAPDHGHAPRAATLGPILLAVAVTMCWALAVYALYTFLAVACDLRGHGGAVPLLLVAYGVGAVIGGLTGGRAADRLGPRHVVTATLLGTAVLEVLVAVAFPATPALIATLAPFALVAYAMFPAQQRQLVDRFPADATTMLSWNNSALFIGLSLAGFLGGPVLHSYGYPTLLIAASVSAVIAALLNHLGSPAGRGGRPSNATPGEFPIVRPSGPDPT